MLMYPLGAQSVKCSVCHFVTNVSQQANWTNTSSAPTSAQQRPAEQTKAMQTVVVENPPTLDDQGNEVGDPRLYQSAARSRSVVRLAAPVANLSCSSRVGSRLLDSVHFVEVDLCTK